MAHPWFHSVSSARKFGGVPDDYIELHSFFDSSKESHGDFRHRSLYHHAAGIFLAERIFGVTLTLSTCRFCGKNESEHVHPDDARLIRKTHDDEPEVWPCVFEAKIVPTRPVAEQHVIEDLGRIPAATEWLSCITPAPWMNRSRQLSRELEEVAVA